jgi:hypothetical protein
MSRAHPWRLGRPPPRARSLAARDRPVSEIEGRRETPAAFAATSTVARPARVSANRSSVLVPPAPRSVSYGAVPSDLLEALAASQPAQSNLEKLAPSYKKQLLTWSPTILGTPSLATSLLTAGNRNGAAGEHGNLSCVRDNSGTVACRILPEVRKIKQ